MHKIFSFPHILYCAPQIFLLFFIAERLSGINFFIDSSFVGDLFLALSVFFFGIQLMRGRVKRLSIGPKGIPLVALAFVILMELQLLLKMNSFETSLDSLFRFLEWGMLYFFLVNRVLSLKWILRVFAVGTVGWVFLWLFFNGLQVFQNESPSDIFPKIAHALQQNFSMIQTSPLLGMGSGQFSTNSEQISNAFFLVAMEFGIPGLIFFVAGIALSLRTVLREKKVFSQRSHRQTVLLLFGMTLAFTVFLFFDPFLFSHVSGQALLTILLAFQAVLVEKEKKLVRPIPKTHAKVYSSTAPMAEGMPSTKG